MASGDGATGLIEREREGSGGRNRRERGIDGIRFASSSKWAGQVMRLGRRIVGSTIVSELFRPFGSDFKAKRVNLQVKIIFQLDNEKLTFRIYTMLY